MWPPQPPPASVVWAAFPVSGRTTRDSEEQRGFEQAGHRAVHSDGNKARSARRTVFDTFQIISIKASDC